MLDNTTQAAKHHAKAKAHQDVVLAHDLVEEGVAGAEVGGKDCVLISRTAALHLQTAQPDMSSSNDCKLMTSVGA